MRNLDDKPDFTIDPLLYSMSFALYGTRATGFVGSEPAAPVICVWIALFLTWDAGDGNILLLMLQTSHTVYRVFPSRTLQTESTGGVRICMHAACMHACMHVYLMIMLNIVMF